MFTPRIIRHIKILKTYRQFNVTATKCENTTPANTPKSAKTSVEHIAEDKEAKNNVIGKRYYAVTNFDRWMLVWVKRFPSKDKVPDTISEDCILHARSKARIRVCNIMIVIFIVTFIGTIIHGKKEMASGNNLVQQSLKRHKELKESAGTNAPKTHD